ncbi:MAG: nucleoside monophosphate kinase, partial [Anaerolineales bacterium]|nr:nucleoside monophosphate kinase [Anaerolineales bacterium]
MATHLVMIGPPGAGKGTQASRLAEKLGLAHVSTGDIFRENIRNETELGARVKTLLESGTLVPDELTIELVQDRLQQPDCRRGAVLDGFPRTPAQAAALEFMLAEQGFSV